MELLQYAPSTDKALKRPLLIENITPQVPLTFDVDPDKLPGDAPLWRSIKRTLSYYHFPAPALQLTPNLRGIAWYR